MRRFTWLPLFALLLAGSALANPPVRSAGRAPDPSFWRGKRVLLTGHSGVKGATMAEMLKQMGAEVYGYSLPPPSCCAYRLLKHDERLEKSTFADINNKAKLSRLMEEAQPDVVIHMAAIAAVEENAANPAKAMRVNAHGTTTVLQQIHKHRVKAAVMITTDKVYASTDARRPLREGDPLATSAAHPYAASKAGASQRINEHRVTYPGESIIVEARAGNIIGHDFTPTRLVPKTVAALESGRPLGINPRARRPWLHVLDAVGGYLVAAEEAMKGNREVDGAFNFAGAAPDALTVKRMVLEIGRRWGKRVRVHDDAAEKAKASPWVLDTSKAQRLLGWTPLRIGPSLDLTVDWYKAWSQGQDMVEVTRKEIRDYLSQEP